MSTSFCFNGPVNTLSRCRFLGPILLACTLVVSRASAASEKASPNILWLIAEDLGPQLGCYGTKEVFTPRLDKLAAEGVRFTRCFSGMVCSPSRSAFMTGMYATTIGAHNHRSHRDDGFQLPAGVRLITDWLREGGYFTANIVKLPPGLGFKGTGKTDWNFSYNGKPFDTADWAELVKHQPFYAQLNFSETHRPYRGKPRANPAKVDLPPYYPDHPIAREDWARYLDDISALDEKVGAILDLLDRDGLATNTVVVFFGDNGQSHVRGKQFCYEEGLHVPLIMRWPKALAYPAKFQPASVDSRLIASIDISATTLALAGIPKPSGMQGRVFLGSQAEPDRDYVFGHRDRCDETVMRIRSVRDKRFRFIRNFTPETPLLARNAYKENQYPVWNLLKVLNTQGKLAPEQAALCAPQMPSEELYDLEQDPHEIRNLAQSTIPEYQTKLAELRTVLDQWIETTHDHGRTPEPPDVAAAQGATKPPVKKPKK